MSDPIHSFKMAGYTVNLYPNRLDIEQGSILGKKTETILLRNVTNVECGLGKPLTIITADGKKHKLSIGGSAAETMRKQIMEVV